MNGGGEGAGGSKAGGGPATRVPSWRERENNRLRERRRRSIAAKIFAGLRTYGNYQLPRNCDNNEVLRALCNEAGWTVEPDGTTYRKGCKPPPAAGDHAGIFRSTTVSSCPSYPLSPSPASSSSQITLGGGSSSSTNLFFASRSGSSNGGGGGSSSFFPWLKAMTGSGGGPSSFPSYGATNFSAPVTPPAASPPLSPPTLRKMARRAADNAVAEGSSAAHYALPPWVIGGASVSRYAAPSYTTPSSPGGRRVPADPATWLPAGFQQVPSARGKAPAYSHVLPPGPFGAFPGFSRLGLAGLNSCPRSPAVPHGGAVPSLALGRGEATVSAWEGEVIKECNEEELELTLGSARTRADRA